MNQHQDALRHWGDIARAAAAQAAAFEDALSAAAPVLRAVLAWAEAIEERDMALAAGHIPSLDAVERAQRMVQAATVAWRERTAPLI